MIIQEYNGQLTQVILKNVETFFPHTRIRYKTNTMAFTTEQYQKIKDGKIKTAILNDGSKARIFLSQGGYICQFRKGSSRRGFQLSEHNIKELIEEKEKQPIDIDRAEYKVVAKFRREALKATFTNELIRECIALSDTFEKWVEDGKKSAYDYHITTGCKITGDLVSIESMRRHLNNHTVNMIQNAIANKTEFSTSRFRYNGYEGSISIVFENGDLRGYFSKEFVGCGNGYYYLLINDEYFIGYDVD